MRAILVSMTVTSLALTGCVPSALRPDGEQACRDDSECGSGLICGEGRNCKRACVPGCREHAQCPAGQLCFASDCEACGCNTPRCRPAPACRTDGECPDNSVCNPDPAGNFVCVPE